MGKQIIFYMSNDVQERFIDFLNKKEFFFVDYNASIINDISDDSKRDIYLYKQDYGNIIMSQNNNVNIDSLKSPIIQYKKTIIKEEQQTVLRGRLWIQTKYYNEKGEVINKGESVLKDYQMLVRWIKTNVPYQQIKKKDHYIKEYINDELKELQERGFKFTI
ncbi:MAG: hypothetical protein HDR13_14180 [Lachnospiraceae bacterium]|nr:hypothetical protein [Lachnospiraceae bacterium]